MAKPRTELTDKQAAQVEALAAYLSKQQIADYLGVSRPTFDAIIERDEVVSLHYKKGKAKAIANVAQGLVKQAIEGNMTAAIFYLKTQAGWKETQVVDNTSSDGSMKPVFNIVGVSPDDNSASGDSTE
ncbi:terminase small subunit [Psychrobacter phage vB_PmaS_Y8A]|nr:terminase small subunit [Psychrobacter phage vB_PmaS_Y8A]